MTDQPKKRPTTKKSVPVEASEPQPRKRAAAAKKPTPVESETFVTDDSEQHNRPASAPRRAASSSSRSSAERKPSHSQSYEHSGAHRRSHQTGMTGSKLAFIVGLMVVAFFGAYNFAVARSQSGSAGTGAAVPGVYSQQSAGVSAGGGGCCGGGGAPITGSATVEGGVQKISVDTSAGKFNPNVIKVKAGVPVEIAFSKSGGGCLSGVYFPDFNINEDLTAGPKTVKLPALQKGTYTFYCQMQMVSAQIVAE